MRVRRDKGQKEPRPVSVPSFAPSGFWRRFLAAFSFVGVLWILWNPKNSRARETGPLEILIIRKIAVLRVFWRRFLL